MKNEVCVMAGQDSSFGPNWFCFLFVCLFWCKSDQSLKLCKKDSTKTNNLLESENTHFKGV